MRRPWIAGALTVALLAAAAYWSLSRSAAQRPGVSWLEHQDVAGPARAQQEAGPQLPPELDPEIPAPRGRLEVAAIRSRAEAQGHSEQARMLEDGVVTWEEYHQVVERALACARDLGVTVEDPRPDWTGVKLGYSFSSLGMEHAEMAREAHDACYEAHAFYVDIAYQTSAAVERERRAVFARTVDCLLIHGLEVELPEWDPRALFAYAETDPQLFQYCLASSRSDPRQLVFDGNADPSP